MVSNDMDSRKEEEENTPSLVDKKETDDNDKNSDRKQENTSDNSALWLEKIKQITCLPAKAKWHLCLWAFANITMVAYLIFSFSLMTEKNVNGAVSTALWVLTIAGIMYSILGTMAITSSLRSRFTFGAFVGSSAFISSQMFLVSIIAGSDLAVSDRDNEVDTAEHRVTHLHL